MIDNYLNQIESKTGLSWQRIAARIAVGFLFATWLGFLPVYLIIHYMVHLNFFSYDLFNDGLFGINAFVLVAGALSILLSFALWGFVPFAWASYIEHRDLGKSSENRLYAWLLIAFAGLFHAFLFINSLYNNRLIVYGVFAVLGLIVCGFICFFVGQPFSKKLLNWMPSCFFVFITALLPFISPEANSQLVSLGLKTFRIGGLIEVEAINSNTKEKLAKGSLILQTPQNLYIKTDEIELVIVPYSQQTIIKVRS